MRCFNVYGSHVHFLIAVFVLWLKSVKECLRELCEISGAPLLGEGSNLRGKLLQIIWDNAESPVTSGSGGFADECLEQSR